MEVLVISKNNNMDDGVKHKLENDLVHEVEEKDFKSEHEFY